MKLSELADKIDGQLCPASSFDDVWDDCGTATGGGRDPDPTQMDFLTGRVEQRLAKQANKWQNPLRKLL